MPRSARRVTPVRAAAHNSAQESTDSLPESQEGPASSSSSAVAGDVSSCSTAMESRVAAVKGRLKARFRQGQGRRFSVRCSDLKAKMMARKLNSSTSSSASSLLNRTSGASRLAALRRKNRALAAALNRKMVECREAEQFNLALKEENMAVSVRLGEANKRLEELEGGGAHDASGASDGSRRSVAEVDRAALEAEFQRRLVEYLDPVKNYMTQVLGHTSSLTDSLTRAMHLVSAPGRRSRSMAAGSGSNSLLLQKNTTPFGKTAAVGGGPAVAHVSPRVSGHAIHKPQIEIQRLGLEDIQRLQQGGNRQDEEPEEDEAAESEEEEEVEDEEEEPLEPNSSRGDVVDAEEDENEAVDSMEEQRQIRRQQQRSHMNHMFRMSDIGEEEEHSRMMESDEGEEEEILEVRRRRSRGSRSSRISGRRFSRNSLVGDSLRGNGSPVVVLDDAATVGLLSQYNIVRERDVADVDNGGGRERRESHREEYDVLMLRPRIVLERVVAPRRVSVSIDDAVDLGVRDDDEEAVAENRKRSGVSRKSRQSSNDFAKRQSFNPRMSATTVAPCGILPTAPKKTQSRQPATKASISPPKVASGTPSSSQTRAESPDETPKSRESSEEFQQRLFDEDPLEGPSWLFGPNNKAKRSKLAKEILERTKRSSSITLKAKIGDVSKRLDMSGEAPSAAMEEPVIEEPEEGVANSARSPKRSAKSSSQEQETIGTMSDESTLVASSSAESSTPSVVVVAAADSPAEQRPKSGRPSKKKSSSTPAAKRKRKIHFSDESKDDETPVATPVVVAAEESGGSLGRGRSRRAAAAAASSSLKEPSLTKKMRQGDPTSHSIYSDYVPGTKPKKKLSQGKKK